MKLLGSLFTPYSKSLLAAILLAGFCLSLFGLALPLFASIIFDKIILHRSYSTLHVIAFGLVILVLFDAVMFFLYGRHVHYLSAYVDKSLAATVSGHLMKLPLRYFETHKRGEITSKVTKLGQLRRVLTAVSVFAVIDILFMVVIVVLIALYSKAIAAVVALTVPVLLALSMITRPSIQRRQEAQRDLQEDYESLISEAVAKASTIKMTGLENWWTSRWQEACERFVDASQAAKRFAAVDDTLVRVVQSLATLLVLWIGAFLALDGRLSVGQLVACWMFARRVMGPSARILNVWQSLQRAWQTETRLRDIVEASGEQDDAASRLPFPQDATIRISELTFRYSAEGPDVLNGVSCDIPAGSFIGIVGKSGSGKSTLAKLLHRHLEPSSGAIFVRDVNLKMIDVRSLRSKVKMVTQDTNLFSGSILENLRAGAEDVTLQQAALACETCVVRKFIEKLPQAYDTVLDENCSQLSSGQRQRLAISRAVLRTPAILILDEATNGLDAETEHTVLKRIRKAMPQTTLIVITHRPGTLQQADKTLVLDSGSLTESEASVLQGLPLREAVAR